MTLALSLPDRIHAATEAYRKEILLPTLPHQTLLCRNLGEELEKILQSYHHAYEKRNADPRGAIISFHEGRFAVAGKEICEVGNDASFVLYLLYQHFRNDILFSTIDRLISWRRVERTMEVLKTQAEASKKVTLTISPSPLRYRLEPRLPGGHQLDFEYHLDRNQARQLQYIGELYEKGVLATTPGLSEVKISLSHRLQQVLWQHFFQRNDPRSTSESDIIFASGRYGVAGGPKRSMNSALGFLLFYLLHQEGEEVSEETVKGITAWKRMPENIRILQDYISPSQIFTLKQKDKSYALVRK